MLKRVVAAAGAAVGLSLEFQMPPPETKSVESEEPDALWHDVARVLQPSDKDWPPTLLHYTTLPTFQKIVESRSIMLFNALTMNDRNEVAGGIRTVAQALDQDSVLQSLFVVIDKVLPLFGAQFRKHFYQSINRDALGTYIFCLSEPDPIQDFGLLSMWRAYGADGNGICIVLDTAPVRKMYTQVRLPVVLYKVRYETEAALVLKVQQILAAVAAIAPKLVALWQRQPGDVVAGLYQILAIACVTHKHLGFGEEKEWRVVNFNTIGQASLARDTFPWKDSMRLGLRFDLDQYAKTVGVGLDQLLQGVILGPSLFQLSASDAVLHVLVKAGFSNASQRIKFCPTPYRPNKS